MKFAALLILTVILLAACAAPAPVETPAPASDAGANMPNPATLYCEQQGNRADIRTAPDGSQFGVCIFPDGSECDEWAYFRGECGPGSITVTPTQQDSGGWTVYQNTELGYSFEYPADFEITPSDNPTESLMITGPDDEAWLISHPPGREEFRPPEGTNLEEWLASHYLQGEKRMPDEQIAGTNAIHFRHDRSPQSYADDRYYFIHGTQLFLVIVGHGEVEDWDRVSRFLQSIRYE